MKNNVLRIIAGILYLPTLALIGMDIAVTPDVFIDPKSNLIYLLLCCLFFYFGSLLLGKTLPEDKAKKLMKITFGIFFAMYVILLLALTLFGGYYRRNIAASYNYGGETYKNYFKYSTNFIPFKTISEYVCALFNHSINQNIVVTNLFGNILAFMPFALFIPMFFKKINNWKKFTLTMICIVAVIEISQMLLMSGSMDIDDLILNVSGSLILYFILQINAVKKFIGKISFNFS